MYSQRRIPPEQQSIRLFRFETYGSQLPFDTWKLTKRSFTQNELIGSSWVCIIHRGTTSILHFPQYRIVVVADPFNDRIKLQGSWELIQNSDVGLVVRIFFANPSPYPNYQYEIFASRDSNYHSGMAWITQYNIPSYLRMIRLA